MSLVKEVADLRPGECEERIGLTDSYSRAVTEYKSRLELWKLAGADAKAEAWTTAECARSASEEAWAAVADHIAKHQC